MKTVRWGIIGLGKIARKFAKDLQATPNTQLVAVASLSVARADAFAREYNVPNAYDSYEAIFQTALDVVYIATPHTHHLACTLLCLRNKVAVLCEKPMAMNSEQVLQMVETARQNDVFLMEAMWSRFMPSFHKIETLIADGHIGKTHTIHADFGFPAIFLPEERLFNKYLGGGALLDIGIYPVFFALLFLGYPIDIQGVSLFGQTGVDETTSIVLKYPEATALLNCSLRVQTNCEASIYGERGSIYLHPRFFETKKITIHQENHEPKDYVFERETLGYNYEIEEVNQCLRQGKKESDKMPLSMSLKLIKILDEIRLKTIIEY